MKNFIEELAGEIAKAEMEAINKGIHANTIILNKDLDFVKQTNFLIGNRIVCTPPMILGKHVFVGELPKDYSFALLEDNTELNYYKERVEYLENKLEKIMELIDE